MVKAAASSTAATAKTEMKRKKKKGRPSLADLQKQNNKNKNDTFNTNSNSKRTVTTPVKKYDFTPARRSTRRNPNSSNSPVFDDDGDDDDDERKEKKVKLVVRLPHSNLNQQHEDSQHSGSEDSDADVDLGGEGHVSPSPKRCKINDVDRQSDGAVSDQGEKLPKALETRHGLQLESGTALPEKKLLVFILDRLQKKDTYGVFSEPVDPEELPDYHEIIEHPMDFGTVRKKLDGGLYANLEELEADVLLICSNAMQYNAPDTVYFRQARTIQDLAKRDFANLRHENDDGVPQPKVVRRGRPPSKNLKKPLEESSVDHVGPELASGASLASGEDKAIGSNSHSLRRGSMPHKIQSSDAFLTPNRSRNGENYSDWSIDWSEFPASILRADMKYGKKNFIVDENKRDTYNDYHPSGSDNELSTLYNINGDMKRLLAVGLQFDRHAYARSLATFAANLGPVAWKIASKKIESVLPAGVKFGPGWVGENEPHSELLLQKSPSNSSRPVTPPAPGITSPAQSRSSKEMVDAVRRLNSQNELAVQGNPGPWGMQGSAFQSQQKSVLHPNRNGFNGMFGYNLSSSQMGMARPSKPSGQSSAEEGATPHQMLSVASRFDTSSMYPTSSVRPGSVEPKIFESWGTSQPGDSHVQGRAPDPTAHSEVGVSGKASYQESSAQHKQSLPIPPDLNVRVRAPGSPSTSLPIGSPQQPDLALQL